MSMAHTGAGGAQDEDADCEKGVPHRSVINARIAIYDIGSSIALTALAYTYHVGSTMFHHGTEVLLYVTVSVLQTAERRAVVDNAYSVHVRYRDT
jgi:hypothetical protein